MLMKSIVCVVFSSVAVLGLLAACGTTHAPGRDGGTGDDAAVPTYTVGGTVSGLSGTLVLRNNGGDDLTVTSDGPFSFATALQDGSSYAVTIHRRPPDQNCSASGESGTIAGDNVTEVEIVCADKTWYHPSSTADYISPDDSFSNDPDVAMDNLGNAIVVWRQLDATTDCPGDNPCW
jgi:hypothetical protein